MNVTRDVILDLLPVYLSGEASPATRALVEEYLSQDPELAARVRAEGGGGLGTIAPSLPPELELRVLARTRRLLKWQKWVFALAWTLTALSLTSAISFDGGRITRFRLLIFEYPSVFGTCLVLAVACWLSYYALKRRLRTSAP